MRNYVVRAITHFSCFKRTVRLHRDELPFYRVRNALSGIVLVRDKKKEIHADQVLALQAFRKGDFLEEKQLHDENGKRIPVVFQRPWVRMDYTCTTEDGRTTSCKVVNMGSPHVPTRGIPGGLLNYCSYRIRGTTGTSKRKRDPTDSGTRAPPEPVSQTSTYIDAREKLNFPPMSDREKLRRILELQNRRIADGPPHPRSLVSQLPTADTSELYPDLKSLLAEGRLAKAAKLRKEQEEMYAFQRNIVMSTKTPESGPNF
jgi:hypothetical protein